MKKTHFSRPDRLPIPLGRSVVALFLCPLLAVLPVAPSFAASPKSGGPSSKESTLATFQLAEKQYRHVTLGISDGDLLVQHDGGVTRHSLALMDYKTLQRIGKVKPALREKADYKAAISTFVPSVSIAGKTHTGVRVAGESAGIFVLLTDDGEVRCQLSDLSPDARLALDSTSRSLARLDSAKAEQQRRVAESQAAAARSAAAAEEARQREKAAAIARYRAAAPRTFQPESTDDSGEEIGSVLGGIAAAGVILWGLSKIFGGDDAGDYSPEDDRAAETRRQLDFFNQRDNQREEERRQQMQEEEYGRWQQQKARDNF